jgi:DNA modification methylase
VKTFYEDKWVKIFHGDCRDLLPTLTPVDLVLTDPPFSFTGGFSNGFASRTDSQFFETWLEIIFKELQRASKPTAAWCLWCDWRTAAIYDEVLGKSAEDYYDQRRVSQVLIHDREMVGMGSPFRNQLDWIAIVRGKHTDFAERIPKNQPNIIREYFYYGKHEYHPSEKSVSVATKLVNWLSDKDATILDPFCGGGTTLVAAKYSNRYSIGIEIEEKYCEIAAKRCMQESFEIDIPTQSTKKQVELSI